MAEITNATRMVTLCYRQSRDVIEMTLRQNGMTIAVICRDSKDNYSGTFDSIEEATDALRDLYEDYRALCELREDFDIVVGSLNDDDTGSLEEECRPFPPLIQRGSSQGSTCSWCHRENPPTDHWCIVCGHAAHLPSMACDCSRCLSLQPIDQGRD